MTVEYYSDLYFLDVVKIVENFHAEAVKEYEGELSLEKLIEIIKSSEPEDSFLLIVDGTCQGLLSGVRFQSLVTGQMIFQELIWYVNKPFRSRGVLLLKEAEKRLQEQGVSSMIMAVLENSKTEKLKSLYEKLGFKKMETHYIRRLESIERIEEPTSDTQSVAIQTASGTGSGL